MPWRLIGFIIILAVFLAFISFNLDNKCDIHYWFKKGVIPEVPVYLTIFVSFIAGFIFALPFVYRALNKPKAPPPPPAKKEDIMIKHDGGPYGID
jgi:uncharacterized integral membrane protein